MQKILTILTALSLAGGVAFANCGHKVTQEGKFTYDAEAKTILVEGTEKPVKLTETTVIKNAEGKEVVITELQGSKVKVVSEHNKADSVTAVAS